MSHGPPGLVDMVDDDDLEIDDVPMQQSKRKGGPSATASFSSEVWKHTFNVVSEEEGGEMVDEEITSVDLRLAEGLVNNCTTEEIDMEPFQDAMAASFAKTERMLSECHEKALQMMRKCMDEVRSQEKTRRELLKQVDILERSSRREAGSPMSRKPSRSGPGATPQRSGCTAPNSHLLPPAVAIRDAKRSKTTQSVRSWLGRGDATKPSWTSMMLGNKVAEFRNKNVLPNKPPELKPSAFSGPPSEIEQRVSDVPEEDQESSDEGMEPVAPQLSKMSAGSVVVPQRSKMSARSVVRAPSGSAPPLIKMAMQERGQDMGSPSGSPSPTASNAPAIVKVPSFNPSNNNSASDSDNERRERRPSMTSNVSKNSHKIELLPQWSKEPKSKKNKKKMGGLSRGMTSDSLASMGSMAADTFDEPSAFNCKKFVLDPNSTPRASWDIASICFVIYDMVMIPLQLFDLPDNAFTEFCAWTTRLFWSFDIFMSLSTGVLKRDGQIEYRFSKIACNYIKTWFLVDALIVAIDWIEVLWSEGSFLGFARAGKASRTFRIIRMVRLLRLARVRNVLHALFERIESEQLSILAGIVSIMLVIVGLSHIIACIWYGLAVEEARPDTWLKVHRFEDAPVEYQYTTALHWSLLQFAGGTDEIVPQNTGERLYAVGVFILAFVLASIFVGRLTSSMTQLHMLSNKDIEKFQVLKRYLTKNEISRALALRVIHNAQHALSETQRFMEENRVELLTLISEPLRVELHFELYSPVLSVHPFFHCFCEACPSVAKKICHSAMSQLLVSSGDVVFMPGEVPVPPQMFIVCSGELTYHYMSGAIAYVEVGHWISEATLWVNWVHQGMLKASSDCRLCRVDAAKFLDFTVRYDSDFEIRRYARALVGAMNSGEMELSDMPYHEDCEEIFEVIHHYERQKDPWGVGEATEVQQTAEESSGSRWKRLSSGSGGQEGDGKPAFQRKQSVLMVTPTAEKKKFWFW